jgi:hypothetical protein
MLRNDLTTWSETDVERLAELYFSVPKPSVEMIAVALGRSTKAIATELSRRGMSKQGAKLRPCLGSGCLGQKKFYSSGIGERICSSCKSTKVMRCA